NVGEEGMPKALTLIGSIKIRPAGSQQLEDLGGEVIVIKDSDILYLTVTYLEGDDEPGSVDAAPRSTRWKWWLAIGVFGGLLFGYELGLRAAGQ
ncbi:hypothetical protein ABC195_16595, partial [Microbacterium sp. 2P01SA-2]